MPYDIRTRHHQQEDVKMLGNWLKAGGGYSQHIFNVILFCGVVDPIFYAISLFLLFERVFTPCNSSFDRSSDVLTFREN